MKPTKLAVCMPLRTGDVTEMLAGELFNIGLWCGQQNIPAVFYAVSRALQDTANNAMAARCLQDPDISHTLWLEDDMVIPPDLLPRLLDTNLDVVSATFFQRDPSAAYPHAYRLEPAPEGMNVPPGTQVYRSLAPELADYYASKAEGGEPLSLYACDSTGLGAILISRAALQAVSDANNGVFFQRSPHKSVDFDICEKIRAAGFQVWVDFSLDCQHQVFRYLVGREHFVATYGRKP